jgi:hypothetical protein
MHRPSGAGQLPLCQQEGGKVVGAALTRIYRSVSAEEALAEQYAFEVEWGAKYRSV